MEGLHVALEDSIEVGVFKVDQIGNGGESLTHVFYADDVMFLVNVSIQYQQYCKNPYFF
ncbi:hypothetical protein HanPI659440_Chr02g0084391 [Helianthus annuus]|nr:hypothetical protein HanPI659440_Chr02g0084391 [Helianthus annuus]